MAEMSVIWLRVAAAFYSLGLLHAILTLVRRREHLFRVAMTAFTLGTVFHFVPIIEEGIVNNRCPIANFYETLSMCALLVAFVYLGVQLRHHVESLSVFIFPLVFVMSLVATLGNPVSAWSSPIVRTTWLTVHIVLVLLGYAALLFTAGASLLYLFQELVSKFMAVGFVLITLAVIAGSTWAFIELKADWIRQPKIAISFFTWGTYLAMVCLRVTAGWRGRRAAIMTLTVVGFSAVTWAAHARLGSLLFKQ